MLDGPGEPTTGTWSSIPALEDLVRVPLATDQEPFDPRLVALDADTMTGQQRYCDLEDVGDLDPLAITPAYLQDLTPPIQSRRRVHCRSPWGSPAAELLFNKELAQDAEQAVDGKTIIVRVRGLRPDTHASTALPLLEFVALVSESPNRRPPPPPRVTAATNFERLFAERRFDETKPCALAHVGPVQRIDDPLDARASGTHHVSIACAHPTGSTWVDVYLNAGRAPRVLQFARGEIIPLRPVASSTDIPGQLPVAIFEGPGALPPRIPEIPEELLVDEAEQTVP